MDRCKQLSGTKYQKFAGSTKKKKNEMLLQTLKLYSFFFKKRVNLESSASQATQNVASSEEGVAQSPNNNSEFYNDNSNIIGLDEKLDQPVPCEETEKLNKAMIHFLGFITKTTHDYFVKKMEWIKI